MIKGGVKDFKNYSLENENIEKLDCSYNQLTSLPKLPDTLIELYCFYNQLVSLPELPDTLEKLNCVHNNLHKGSESPLISFAVGGMKATQYKDSNFLNKLCFFFKLLYICIYL